MAFDGIGIQERKTDAGIRVIRLHYTAHVPKRDPAWQRAAREGYTSQRDWDREMEINWSIASGFGVYTEDFDWNWHVAREAFEPAECQELVLGFDFGLQPACIWLYVTAKGCLRVFRETVTWEGRDEPRTQGIDKLLDEVLLVHRRRYAKNPLEIAYHDPAGDARSQTDEKTCAQYVRSRLMIAAVAGPITSEARRAAMRGALGKNVGGVPFLQLSPACLMLTEGLGGAYKYKQAGDGLRAVVSKEPEKNAWSHPVEALEYAIGGLVGRDEGTWRKAQNLRRRRHG